MARADARDATNATDDTMKEPEARRTPWLTVLQAAERAQCSMNSIYLAIRRGKLRAVRIGTRKEYRTHITWVDAWLESAVVVNPDAPGEPIPFRRSG